MINYNIKKIFIGGSVMSGKATLTYLLDGHPQIICNFLHDKLIAFLFVDDCKKALMRAAFGNGKLQSHIPAFKIKYDAGETVNVDIGSFFRCLYLYTGYASLYSHAMGGMAFTMPKTNNPINYKFNFNFQKFEKNLKKHFFFTEKKVFTQEEIVDVLYSSYLDSWNNSIIAGERFWYANMLSNGAEAIKKVSTAIPDAKIIYMNREPIPLIYSNATRMMGDVEHDKRSFRFKSSLYNQTAFYNKIMDDKKAVNKLRKESQNILIVDFEKMVLDTKKTMRCIAGFLDVEFKEIFSIPTMNGEPLNSDLFRFIGQINDDPKIALGKKETDLLNYYYGAKKEELSIISNVMSFFRALGWRCFEFAHRFIGKSATLSNYATRIVDSMGIPKKRINKL